MSRIGKQPIEVPVGVKVEVEPNLISVSGPKGGQSLDFRPEIKVEVDKGKIFVKRKNEGKVAKSLHGLVRTLISNMVTGVTKGWEKTLEVVGTGYGARLDSGKLILKLGFSTPFEFTPPDGVTISVSENKIKVEGINKAKVGEVAAKIRAISPPNVYSGKGIRYAGEVLKLKPGKAAKAVGVVGK